MSRRRRHNQSSGKGFAAGALLGGLIGGVTALLFAPTSGEKMRKDLAKKCHTVSDKTHDILEDMCEHTGELIEKAKDIAHEAKAASSKMARRKRR